MQEIILMRLFFQQPFQRGEGNAPEEISILVRVLAFEVFMPYSQAGPLTCSIKNECDDRTILRGIWKA